MVTILWVGFPISVH